MKKNFLILFIAIFACVGMFSACTQPQETKSDQGFIIQLWSVNNSTRQDFEGTIRQLAEMGYTGVEIFDFTWGNGTWFGLQPAEVRRIADYYGVELVSSHLHRVLAPNPEETNWDAIWAYWDRAFDAHLEAGIRYLVDPAVRPDRLQSREHVLAYAEYFNEIGRRAAARGLSFGYHNHDWELTIMHDGQSVWDILIENTDPEYVFFQLDLYWVVRARNNQYVVDLFNRHPGRFHHLHVKDVGALGGENSIMDFPLIFNNLENSGAMYMIVEIERVPDQMAAARQSIEYLRTVDWWRDTYLD